MLARARRTDDDVAEVVRLVWLTTRHNVEDGDRNGALLCDADLAILGHGAGALRRIRRRGARRVRGTYQTICSGPGGSPYCKGFWSFLGSISCRRCATRGKRERAPTLAGEITALRALAV